MICQMNKPASSLSNEEILDILSLSRKATAIYTSENIVIEFANDQMISFWGKDRNVIGLELEVAVPELKGQPFIALLQQVWRTGNTYTAENQSAELRVNGKLQRFHFNFEYKAIKNEHGEVYSILHTATDVTQLNLAKQALDTGLLREHELNRKLLSANASLGKSQDKFASLVKNAPVAITFLQGPELLVELVNKKMLEIWGRREEQVINLSILDETNPLIDPEQVRLINRVYETQDPYYGFSVKINILSPFSVITRYFDLIYEPVLDVENEVIGVMIVATDVTEHSLSFQREQSLAEELTASNNELAAINEEMHASNEELNRREDQLQFIIDAAEIGIWDLDLRNLQLSGNDRFKSWLGLSEQDAISLSELYKVIHKDDYAHVSSAIKEALREHSSGKFNVEFQLNIPGELLPRYIAAKGKASFNIQQQPLKFSGTMMDITERKQDELRKNDFIGMVSHELKTPLTSLNGYSQILQSRAKKNQDEFSVNALKKIGTQVSKMTALINGFLNISRLESGKIHLEKKKFNLDELIAENIKESELLTETHQILFTPCPPVEVEADKDKISSVITNFISNAVKYSPAGKLIEIQCEVSPSEVRVGVKDHGMGIKKEDSERLFERFYRVRNGQTQLISGFGIGLYLSAEIVKSHSGKIWVDSIPGEGSTFFFTLPLSST